MAKKKAQEIDFPFYIYLKIFLDQNRKKIYLTFKPVSKKILDFNSPDNPDSWLRKPQFEALEIYVFLKEFLNNDYMFQIFEDWHNKKGRFLGRADAGVDLKTGQFQLFDPIEELNLNDKAVYKALFEQIKSFEQIYPNYIFALTMGLGKTVLMATSIFYEFILANKYPKDSNYCHNALVFAPDKTVLQSLNEIQTFDKSKVIPPEYVNWLNTNLKFHFLDDSGISLNAIENSKYNIIISNTQKIILKKQHKDKTATDKLFEKRSETHYTTQNHKYDDLMDDEIETEQELLSNQRFAKLLRLEQLGIYVDEAHHVFGTDLAKDFGMNDSKTSLRITINELAGALKEAGTKVVGCFNYTGTPYVGKKLLPEVVYTYGLKNAIDNGYLKKAKVLGFSNVKNQTKTFVKTTITEFWDKHKNKRYEGLLPKLAIFSSTIDELDNELRPVVEEVLSELDIPINKILINVGDDTITKNDDIREFKNLDSPHSDKQFILLVNKGKEGWNCRSLFGVALNREPKSKIFVLQATMRCLRSITDTQQTGMVFLSDENVRILSDELENNFNISLDDFKKAGEDKITVPVKTVPPPIKIKLSRVKKLHVMKEKEIKDGIDLKLDEIDYDRYTIIRKEKDLEDLKRTKTSEVIKQIELRQFSELTLVAEIARYLYRPDSDGNRKIGCLEIKSILESSKQGINAVLKVVNEYNVILYDWIIPRIFGELYTFEPFESKEEEEIELVREPDDGYYNVKAKKDLIASVVDEKYNKYSKKSFHLDNYCFDSIPESEMFWALLHNGKLDKVWFTGMLTYGQSDFLIRYIDPESHTVRSYYPDFLVKVKTDDGTEKYIIIEVKGDNKIDDAVVRAKVEYASQLASASGMEYKIIKGSEARDGIKI